MTGAQRTLERQPQQPTYRTPWHQWKKRVRRSLGIGVARLCGPTVFRLLAKTWTCEVLRPEHRASASRDERGVIMTLWHGSMLLSIAPFLGEDFTILVSPSEDGDASETLLRGLNFATIRGSRSQGGTGALRALIAALERGSTVALTPDGPRGPRHSVNPGAAWMAQATGDRVLPSAFACDRAWQLSSWDRCLIPKPGARIILAFGEPLGVSRGDDLEAASAEIRARMLAAEAEAWAALGQEQP